MKQATIAACCLALASGLSSAPVRAQEIGQVVRIGEGLTLDPIVAARLRYETVDQDGVAESADALTRRGRIGAELEAGGFSILAEGEGTVALAGGYNDTLLGNGVEPFPVVADPENVAF